MQAHRTMTLALLSALLLSVVIVMTASAAPPSPFHKQLKPQPANIKYVGTTQFKTSPNKPAKNVPDSKQFNVNRGIPGKALKTHSAQPSQNFPLVNPTMVVSNTPGHLAKAKGLNAYDTWQANEAVFQPPDQGLCAGNGYVLEMVNEVAAVYDSNMNKITGNMSLDDFFSIPLGSSGGDPKCYYDPGSKRFFATQLAYGEGGVTPDLPSVPFHIFVLIAVSQTMDPRLGWYLYALDVTYDCPDPGTWAPCLGDQPLIGANRDAFIVSTNDYSYFGPYFSGTNLYILDKTSLVAGSFSELVNGAYIPVGAEIDTPDDVCCWYTVQPAFAATTGNWDNRMGGIEYFLSSLDLFNEGDNRITLWALTNTKTIHSAPINWNFELWYDVVNSEQYIVPYGFSGQKDDGLIPFGRNFADSCPSNCPTQAGPIQPNDDRMNQVFQSAGRTLWAGVNTGLFQKLGNKMSPEYHNGIAYFGLRPQWTAAGDLSYQWVTQGYVAPYREDALFPAIAMSANKVGAMVFTLTSGPNGGAGSPSGGGGSAPERYPSAAYTLMTTSGAGNVFVSNAGMSSYDGSCEYNLSCGGGYLRPRWGDYSAAVVMNDRVYMATEYIQYPTCGGADYLADMTCGDTRAWRQNWGTALGRIYPY